MRSLASHLAAYGAYHQDRRNIVTHFFGIPLIVTGVATLLSRPRWLIGALPFSPTVLVALGSVLFYLNLDLRFGLVMAGLFGGATALGACIGAQSTAIWLGLGLGAFAIGWAVQLVGHVFEGRKPAFVDDLIGLLVGPLFLVAEAAFALGLRPEVKDAVDTSSTTRPSS